MKFSVALALSLLFLCLLPGRRIGVHLSHRRGEPAAVHCSGQRARPHKCQYAVLVTRRCSARSAARWHTWWDDWTMAHHTHRRARRDAIRHMVTALTGAQSVGGVRQICCMDPCPPSGIVYPKILPFHKFGARAHLLHVQQSQQVRQVRQKPGIVINGRIEIK